MEFCLATAFSFLREAPHENHCPLHHSLKITVPCVTLYLDAQAHHSRWPLQPFNRYQTTLWYTSNIKDVGALPPTGQFPNR
eukprot:4997320-Amphidinium_carterae.1